VHAGALPYVQRISGRGFGYLHLSRAAALINTGQQTSDLVAAVPSLHSAGVLLFAIFMWKRVRRRYRPLLALYPLAMTFTLVYSGEHYVTDVLLGWVAAVFVAVVAALAERRFAAQPEVAG
jgi:membrane-associated phospholipid phosphatase